MSEKLTLKYVALSTVRLWDRNPKPHDIGALIQSYEVHGFKDPPSFEPELNKGEGGTVEGNGRVEALQAMLEGGADPPRGIGLSRTKEWTIPVLFGVDAPSEAAAEAYALDHNALTIIGSNFGPSWATELYDIDPLTEILTDLAAMDKLPVSIDGDDLDAILSLKDYDKELEQLGGDGDGAGRCVCEVCGNEHYRKAEGE